MEKFSYEQNGYSRSDVNQFISEVIVETEKLISVVKKYWNDPNIVIYVGTDCTTSSNADGLTVDGNYYKATSVNDYTSTHNTESLSNYTTSSGSKGITTSARYTAKLIRVNANVVGVRFDKQ